MKDDLVIQTIASGVAFDLGAWGSHPMRKFVIPGEDGEPYLTRYVLAEKPDGSKVYLHFIHQSDSDRDYHDHPWPWRSCIVSGAYREHAPGLPPRIYGPGDWNDKPDPAALHRLEVVAGPVITVVYRGPRVRRWGFRTPPAPWIDHEDYLDAKYGKGNWAKEYE